MSAKFIYRSVVVSSVIFSMNLAQAEEIFSNKAISIRSYDDKWCKDNDMSDVIVTSKTKSDVTAKLLNSLHTSILRSVAKKCKNSVGLYVFVESGDGLKLAFETNNDWDYVDSKEGTSNQFLFDNYISPFVPKREVFNLFAHRAASDLSQAEFDRFMDELKVNDALAIIAKDKDYASNESEYKVAQLAVTIPALIAIGAVAGTLFSIESKANYQKMWSERIEPYSSIKTQMAILQTTIKIGADVVAHGGKVGSVNVELNDRCARETPAAMSAATLYLGVPPSKMIIPTEKIGDQKYIGQGWEKWIYDHKNNGLFIQIHYMYQPSTKIFDKMNVEFCRPLQ